MFPVSRRFLSILILLTSLICLPIPVVEAAGTLYANPSSVNLLSVGSTFKIGIKVANIDLFNGWDVEVATNTTVIVAQDISLNPNILTANASAQLLLVTSCIDGVGSGCQPSDGPGITHSALAGTASTSGNGVLFTINYKVVGSGSSKIHIINDVIANANLQSIPHSTVDAFYGVKPITPDFSISSPQTPLNVTQGDSLNVTITLASLNRFAGPVSVTTNTSIAGVRLNFYPAIVRLTSGGTNSTTLTVNTNASSPVTQLTVIVIGRIGRLVHDLKVPVSVLLSADFLLIASPSLLLLHAGDSGISTIIVESQQGFSGSVQLGLRTNSPAPIVAIDTNTLSIPNQGSASTTLRVQTPSSNTTFHYTITVTVTSDKLTHSMDIFVTTPPADFALAAPSEVITLKGGESSRITVTVTSKDFFKGVVYLLATSSTGTRLSYTNSIIPLSYTDTLNSTLTLTTDPSITPGVHYVILTAISGTLTHSANVTFNVPGGTATFAKLILGLQPLTYFGIIAGLGVALGVLAVREIRRPKSSGRRISLEDSPIQRKISVRSDGDKLNR